MYKGIHSYFIQDIPDVEDRLAEAREDLKELIKKQLEIVLNQPDVIKLAKEIKDILTQVLVTEGPYPPAGAEARFDQDGNITHSNNGGLGVNLRWEDGVPDEVVNKINLIAWLLGKNVHIFNEPITVDIKDENGQLLFSTELVDTYIEIKSKEDYAIKFNEKEPNVNAYTTVPN